MFGSTVKEEVDAINNAAIEAYRTGGDTILIDSFYHIDNSIFLFKNCTYLGTNDNAGFKKINPAKTILTDTAFWGDNQLKVLNNDGFRTYQKINIANNIQYDSLAGFSSYTASVASFLGDTIIFLSGLDIQKEMYPGDSVSLFFPIMTSRYNDLDSFYLENLVFDGNSSQYTLNFDWRTNSSILSRTTEYSQIKNCHFQNTSNENIIICGTEVIDCTGEDFNGSAIHFSCNSYGNPSDILYNEFTNTNIIGDSIMEHSESAFTFSAKVSEFRMAYNKIINANEFGIGVFQNDDNYNEITDNLIDSKLDKIAFQFGYLYLETNIIYNNKSKIDSLVFDSTCWIHEPKFINYDDCAAHSTLENPLQIGDTITIDSIIVNNSSGNYLKIISPIYDEEYFELIDLGIETPFISPNHSWQYHANNEYLIFDNGHRNGVLGESNWGFELCGKNGFCNQLHVRLKVIALPDSTSSVNCPFQGIELFFDGDINTWNYPNTCPDKTYHFLLDSIHPPILEGDSFVNNSEGRCCMNAQIKK